MYFWTCVCVCVRVCLPLRIMARRPVGDIRKYLEIQQIQELDIFVATIRCWLARNRSGVTGLGNAQVGKALVYGPPSEPAVPILSDREWQLGQPSA